MELQPLKISFNLKKKSGNAESYSLYMRLIFLSKRTEICTHLEIKKEDWDEKRQMIKTNTPEKTYTSNLVNQYRHKALAIYQQLVQRDMDFDVFTIREKLTGKEHENFIPTLLQLFDKIIKRKKTLLGEQGNSKTSIQKYKRCRSHIVTYLKLNYNVDDMKFGLIDLPFLEDFELYLKTAGNCCHNTSMKHIQTLRTIYKSALSYGWTNKDPFQRYKVRMEEVVRDYLTEKELQSLINLDLPACKLTHVRDLFVFCCFTGLAYIDLKNLTAQNIHLENGKYWIRTRRQKTNVKSNIPLLSIPLQMIRKYCPKFETTEPETSLFRVISNQKMNEYLKELATLVGIKKFLTFHIARHTFATTVTLNNGVPIESVSAMLGHKHITTTQHYAKLLDKKLEADMDILGKRLLYFR